MRRKTIGMFAAGAMALGVVGTANAFMFDLNVVNGGTGPGFVDLFVATGGLVGDADKVTGQMDQVDFSIEDNYVTILGWFTDPVHNIGDTYSFSETGLVNYAAFLPTSMTDTEQYRLPGAGWELNGDFALTGTAELTAYDAGTGRVALDFTFTGGTLDIYYDEILNGLIDGTQKVVTGVSTGGGGLATQFEGGAISGDQGSFDADFHVTDLLDGFILANNGTPFVDDLTLSFADGNIDQTQAVFGPGGSDPLGLGDGRLVVLANSNGSQEFAPVPEPGTMVLLGSGLLGLASRARRREKKS